MNNHLMHTDTLSVHHQQHTVHLTEQQNKTCYLRFAYFAAATAPTVPMAAAKTQNPAVLGFVGASVLKDDNTLLTTVS